MVRRNGNRYFWGRRSVVRAGAGALIWAGTASFLGLVQVVVPGTRPTESASWAAPPANATFDYQIGGQYVPSGAVRVVSRDRLDPPAAGKYNICYVNAFQTQDNELVSVWKANKNLLLARPGVKVPASADPTRRADAQRYWVRDSAWSEILLDISTSAKRVALIEVIGPWIDRCAADGYDAIEPDNLDSWSRNRESEALLSQADAEAFARLLATRAHGQGLAIGQKNTTVVLQDDKDDVGFDFAVAEECGRYGECGDYAAVYGGHVIAIEYREVDFRKACKGYASQLSIVLRNRTVGPPSGPGYRYDDC
jgi:hypothetical protein